MDDLCSVPLRIINLWSDLDDTLCYILFGRMCLRSDVEDRMDMRMCQEVGTDYTLIIAILIEDDAFDHMFSESRLHALNCRFGKLGSDMAGIVCGMSHWGPSGNAGANNRSSHSNFFGRHHHVGS
uniref:Uncharacterized protein n=1 Tax=Romanomermis culicivorax TaxID=13658 RepID=A0A915JS01_ROMCU